MAKKTPVDDRENKVEEFTSYSNLGLTISNYLGKPVTVKNRKVDNFGSAISQSKTYVISEMSYQSDEKDLPSSLFLKIYPKYSKKFPDKNMFKMDEEYNLERNFLHFSEFYKGFSEQKNTSSKFKKDFTAFPTLYSYSDEKYTENLAMLSKLPEIKTLFDLVDEAKQIGSETKMDSLVNQSLYPLVLLHEKAILELNRENGFYNENPGLKQIEYLGLKTRSPRYYFEKFFNYLEFISRTLNKEGNLDSLRDDFKENFEPIGNSLSYGDHIDSVIHADLHPGNHILISLVDAGNIRLGPSTLDYGFLYGSSIFDENLISTIPQKILEVYTDLNFLSEGNLHNFESINNNSEFEKNSRLASFFARIRESTIKLSTLEQEVKNSRSLTSMFDDLENLFYSSNIPKDLKRSERELQIITEKDLSKDSAENKNLANLINLLREIGIYSNN